MRKIILFCLVFSFGFGQTVEKSESIQFKVGFRAKLFKPFYFGDNYLAKANKASTGVGANLDVVEYRNFILGGGFDYTNHSVTDVTRAGAINRSVLTEIYGTVAYRIVLSDDWQIHPFLGFGDSKISFSAGDRDFGHQTGNNYRIGVNADYKVDKTVTFFAGLGFNVSKYDINTSPEFVSFYDNSKILQITLGLKLH